MAGEVETTQMSEHGGGTKRSFAPWADLATRPLVRFEAVTKRFYRSDKSRRTEGLGLGLSLVAAIVKLHDFRFTISAGPGCTAEIACRQAQ